MHILCRNLSGGSAPFSTGVQMRRVLPLVDNSGKLLALLSETAQLHFQP